MRRTKYSNQIQNEGFYPTPKNLIAKMYEKGHIHYDTVILEPSAGNGAIIDYISDQHRAAMDISAIEIDEELRHILRGKSIKVIDTDFLEYSGPDKFDLIIANPPFSSGDLHLLKAINIMYSGEIIFLLNAETIKNPYTNIRKELVKKLEKLNAEIEYIQDAFKNAERPTGVEVALIYIKIERSIESDLFEGCDDKISEEDDEEIKEHYEISTKKNIADLVAEYNQIITIGTQTLIDYYKNYKKIGKFICLNQKPEEYHAMSSKGMTAMLKKDLNVLLASVRVTFWRKTLALPEVVKRMTSKKREEFEITLKNHCAMDFTENNIRQFVLNLIGSYEQSLTEAVLDIFDKFSIRHTWSDNNLYDDNIHYFNGWKTNKAFKVGKKVIIPIHARYYSNPFIDDYSGAWKLAFNVDAELSDIDKVMNYFDGMSGYLSIASAIETAFAQGKSRKIKSTYFTITCYKKGTIHLIFNDESILRRFNVVACKGKKWLPSSYGEKAYSDFSGHEKEIVENFEGAQEYVKYSNQPLFAKTIDPRKLLPIK